MKKGKNNFIAFFFFISLGILFASGLALDGIMMNQTSYHFIRSSRVIDKTLKAGGNIREVKLDNEVLLDSYSNRDGLVSYTLKKKVTFVFQGSRVLKSHHLFYLSEDAFQPIEP